MLSGKKIAANTSFFMTALVLQKVLSFVYFTFLARNLGTVGIGQYFFAISFASMFSVLIDLGLSPLIIREVARESEDSRKWFHQIFSLKVILACLTVLIILSLNWILFYDDAVRNLIFITTAIIVVDSFTLLFYAFIRGRQNLKWESWGTIIFQILVLVAGFSLMQFSDQVFLFLIVLLLASLFNLFYSAYILLVKYKLKLKFYFSQPLVKHILKVCLPFALAAIFAKVYAYMDTFLLKIFLGDEEVGFYSVAYKMTFALQFIPLAFVAALYPAFANYFNTSKDKLKEAFSRSFSYLAFISLPLAFGTIALAGELVEKLYTSRFVYSVLPLQILIASIPFLFINFSLSSLLNAAQKEKINTRNLGIVMSFNVLLNLIFIPWLGIWGASLASSLSTLLLFTLNLRAVVKLVMEINWPNFWPVLGSLLSAVFMFWLIIQLKEELNWIVSALLGGAAYVVLMFASRSLKWRDIVYVKNAIFKSS
ncbi:MAG: oligosaccharide flippase family protein [Patescibacteria group bacterium]|nr:oligosaccharide flippase family protein [Patescibacteria group bacterium]